MASASTERFGPEVGVAGDREAVLEEKLRRSERRREAAEEWGEFLERELEARDRALDDVIAHYEAQLQAAQARTCECGGHTDGPSGSLWQRLGQLVPF